MYNNTLVIIPTYNEAENIESLVKTLCTLYEGIHVLVVDDGNDETASIVTQVQNTHPTVKVLKRGVKSGRGSAVLAGIAYALENPYTRIVEMDADFSHNPKELSSLLAVAEDTTVVIGSRYLKSSRIENWPLRRKIFSACANVYANLILGIGIHDYTNGYRVYGRKAAEGIDMERIKSRGYIVLSEVAYQLFVKGFTFREVPTIFINRSRGVSNFSLNEIKEAFTSVIRIRKMYGRPVKK